MGLDYKRVSFVIRIVFLEFCTIPSAFNLREKLSVFPKFFNLRDCRLVGKVSSYRSFLSFGSSRFDDQKAFE